MFLVAEAVVRRSFRCRVACPGSRRFGSVGAVLALTVLTACATIAFAATSEPGPVRIENHHVVVGELAPGDQRTVVFSVENRSDSDIRVLDLTADDEGLVLHSDDCVIGPGETGRVSAFVTAGRDVGPWWARGRIRVRWTGPDGGEIDAEHPLAVSGFVNSAYDTEGLTLDFGVFDPATGHTRELRVASREVSRLAVRGFDAPAPFAVEIEGAPDDPQAATIRISLPPGLNDGAVDSEIVVRTNVERQHEVRVACSGHAYRDVVPSPLPVRFRRSEGAIVGTFELRSRHAGPLSVTEIRSEPPGMVLLGRDDCSRPSPSCVSVEVSPRRMRPLAGEGTITVRFEDGSRVDVPFVMKTRPRQIPASLVPFMRSAEQTRARRAPTGDAATVRWEVSGDAGVFGYIVYRAERRAGPFVRVKGGLIPALGTAPGEIAEYEVADPEAGAGDDFFYYVDALLVDGRRQALTGVGMRERPTGPPVEEP